jgi:ankyrin repeat protein
LLLPFGHSTKLFFLIKTIIYSVVIKMAAAIEEIRVHSVDGEIEALPADLQFLRQANTNGICRWFAQNEWNQNAPCMSPIVWRLLEKRIREHPNEAREVVDGSGGPPIQLVLLFSSGVLGTNFHAAPLSLIQLLIELHPDGLHVQNSNGCIPLHWATYYPCIDCFRAVLYNGGVEATTVQTRSGETPLAWSTDLNVGLAMLWELLCFNHHCMTIQDDRGMTALELLQEDMRPQQEDQVKRHNAKIVLLKLAANYNHVPKVPNDATIAIVEFHPVCTVLAPRLEPDRDAFVLHRALEAKCPHVLAEALVQVFQTQIQQVDTNGRLPLHCALQHGLGASVRLLASKHGAAMYIADPFTGLLPIEQAILNVAKNGLIENVDAVNALLRANPGFLERIG